MNILDSIIVDSSPATTLQIFHKRLKIPIAIYLEQVAEYTDPWQEKAYQLFMQSYLEKSNDPGIIGMVREEHDADYVYLDAAIRYPFSIHQ